MPTVVRKMHVASLFAVSLTVLFCISVARADDVIRASDGLPDTQPWDLQSLSEAPEFEWADAESPVRSLFYKGEPYAGHATRVFAYYATPGTLSGDRTVDKQLPAVVLIHGGGGTAFREWAELWARRGYAAIAMDLAGYRPMEGVNQHDRNNRTRLDDGGPDQGNAEKFLAIDKPVTEQWPYHAVANAIRAHSLIRSFEEVDADRTAVTGISWGGYLTCIVSGVDSRFKAAVPVYGCGFLFDNSAWLQQFADMTPVQRERWITLWDPSRYLPAVSMPILFVNGTNDFAYPLDSYRKSIDAVPAKAGTTGKQICITVKMPHSHPAGWAPPEIGLFIDQHLRGGDPLPVISIVDVQDGHVTVAVHGTTAAVSATLHYTTDATPVNQREWIDVPATSIGKLIRVGTPPSNSTAWFVTVRDQRNAVVSTQVVFPGRESK